MRIRLLRDDDSFDLENRNHEPFDPILDIVAMFIEEECFGSDISDYKSRIEDPESSGYGNNQVGITKTDDGMFEMSDHLLDADDDPTILLDKKQLMGILDLIEETGATLRTLKAQKKLPKEVIYTFDDDWNGSVEFKN